LSLDEIRFLIARSETTTDKEAATAIGYSPRTIVGWPAGRKELIRRALRYMAQDGLVTALHLRRRNLAKAMAVKVRGLDSDDDRLRQQVATELIEWELGKATQTNKNEDSGEFIIRVVRDKYAKRDDSPAGTPPGPAEDGE